MLIISNAISANNSKPALVPFVTAGYPNLDVTMEVIALLDQQGVQAIELGIPYSDALADGTVIQESSQIALAQKTYVDKVLNLVKAISPIIKAPIIIFTYLNPILSIGIELFVKEIAQSGAKGLVVPDLPLEESDYFITVCTHYSIELILFVSPSSSYQRIQKIVMKAPGCIYLVSSYGVTGTKDHIAINIQDLVEKIKLTSNKRVMLGFGISNEAQVASIAGSNLGIDAVVIGTAFINHIKYSYSENSYNRLNMFCNRLKDAIRFS